VDYIKADDIASPFHGDEIAALHRAIVKSKRPIVLSLSPGPADLAKADFYAANAKLMAHFQRFLGTAGRTSAPISICWKKWSPHTRRGHWPDADMLPLGRIGIRAERRRRIARRASRAMNNARSLSLWSIACSPPHVRRRLAQQRRFTLSLLTNDEVLAADQNADAQPPTFPARGPGCLDLGRVGSNGKYLAVFNVGNQAPLDIRVKLG